MATWLKRNGNLVFYSIVFLSVMFFDLYISNSGGSTQQYGKFFEGAFSPVILNLCMILSMVVGKYFLV